MYRVIDYFTDLHDNGYPYKEGDIFPRDGITVSEKRLAQLAGIDNKRGRPVIALVEEPEAEPDVKPAEKPRAKRAKKSEIKE